MRTKRLVDYSSAARILDLKLGTLQSMVARRQIPHLRLGPRLVRFDPEQLHAWLRQRSVDASRFGSQALIVAGPDASEAGIQLVEELSG